MTIASISQPIGDMLIRKNLVNSFAGYYNEPDVSPYAGSLTQNNPALVDGILYVKGIVQLLGPYFAPDHQTSVGLDLGGTYTVTYIDLYGWVDWHAPAPRSWNSVGNQVMVLSSLTNGSFVVVQTFTNPPILIDLPYPNGLMTRLIFSTPPVCNWIKIVAPYNYGLYCNTGGWPFVPSEIVVSLTSVLSVSQPIKNDRLRRSTGYTGSGEVTSISQPIKDTRLRRQI
jgi:hypothetical protein